MYMANLKPDILFVQRPWRIVDNIPEALCTVVLVSDRQHEDFHFSYLQTLLEFLLLLIDYAKSEVDFICLLEVWLHSHHL